MVDLKIRVYKSGGEPATTVTIPGNVLRIASGLVPASARRALEGEGIDLAEIVRLSETDAARGVLAEIEDHDKGERVVVSLE